MESYVGHENEERKRNGRERIHNHFGRVIHVLRAHACIHAFLKISKKI